MALSPKTYTFLCGCFAALGSILFGYDLGIIASILPSSTFLETTGHPDSTYLGFITSSLLLGAFVGCIPASIMADRLGRRFTIIAGSLIFLLGGGLQTGAQKRGEVLAGRFFAGMGIGFLSFVAPVYQSEIAHPSIRGRLTSLQQFFLGIGSFIASFVGYGCYKNYPGTQFQWRFPLGLQLAPAVPLACLILLFPESPRWLVKVGRYEDARKSLARLHSSGNEDDLFVKTELAELIEAIEEENILTQNAWSQIFFIPSNFRRVAIGVILQFSVQMTGVSVIQYYSTFIFAAIGFNTNMTLLLQSINSVIALGGEFACVWYVDRTGRRLPLIIANAISGATFCVGTAIQAQYPAATTNNIAAGGAFVAMTWIFNFFFSAAIGPLSWAVPVEIMNTNIRAKATAITSMAAWVSNFMIAQVSPVAFANIGWKYYLVFAICGFTNALTMWAIIPEMKGKTLEETDYYFKNTGWFVPGNKLPEIKSTDREEELRRGIAVIGDKRIDVEGGGGPGPSTMEKREDEKIEIQHAEASQELPSS